MHKILFLIISFLFIIKGQSQDTIRTEIILDSLDNEVYLIMDKADSPLYYYSPIFTPVCVDGSCYPIYINLFWNLGGSYLKYELPTGEILTKAEHLPFSRFDYGLLHRVLANEHSALANYSIYELTVPNNDMGVDGVTGATRTELQGAFVPEALFTSYTLWHLINRQKVSIQAYTIRELIAKGWMEELLFKPSLGAQILALDALTKNTEILEEIKVLCTIIDTNDTEIAHLSLLKVQQFEQASTVLKPLLSAKYTTSLNIEIKKTILSYWSQKKELESEELAALITNLGSNSSLFNQELELLSSTKLWPDFVYYSLYEKYIATSNLMRKAKFKNLLFSRKDSFPKKLKKILNSEV